MAQGRCIFMTTPANEKPVQAVGTARLAVSGASVPIYMSDVRDEAMIERVVIVLHGRLRDADAYLRPAEHALLASSASGDATLLVVPQFLASADVEHHALANDVLHWE